MLVLLIVIGVILETRWVQFLGTVFDYNYTLYKTVIKYSLHNGNTTLCKRVR